MGPGFSPGTPRRFAIRSYYVNHMRPSTEFRVVTAAFLCLTAVGPGFSRDSQVQHALNTFDASFRIHAQQLQLRVRDLDDRVVDPFDHPGAKALVLLFTTVDCPIANRYAPEIRRLINTFRTQGIEFRLVYPHPSDQPDAIREHIKSFEYPVVALRDPSHDLVRLASATVTPEVAVYQGRQQVYRGRIDNRYAAIGVDRQTPSQRDLDAALTAIVTGRRIANATTRAVGCVISDLRGADGATEPVTFSKHIAPIVLEHCARCHRPDGPAPFSLLTYDDVRQRATLVAAVTRSRYMPPWKSEPGYGDFVGQKHLTDREIDLFRQWVGSGTPEGKGGTVATTEPVSYAARRASGWQLGTPDMIVTLPEAFDVPPDGTDVFRIFVLPLSLGGPRYVRGLEFRPGNARAVHHANIRIDRTRRSRDLDAQDAAPGYDGLLARTAEYPAGHFFGWTPGQVPSMLPASLAWRLDPATDLVIQAHMQPTGKPERVQLSVGFYFADDTPGATPSVRTPAMVRLGRQTIDIPAGVRDYTISDSFTLPVDVDVLAVQPHAHYLARTVKGFATLPDGTTKWLIQINDWDFRWQHVYRLVAPLPLPKGTIISMTYSYDNSIENARNPQPEPRRVTWGQRSSDEMGDLWVQVLTRNESDLVTLNNALRPKVLAEDVAGYEMVIRASPPDAALHEDVALLYLELGRTKDAIAHFQKALQLKPASAMAHFNLATALTVDGQLDAATEEYERALSLDPRYASAHNNLGSVLLARNRRADALRHLREAVRLDASNAQAHRNLAWELATSSLSTAADLTDAVRFAERAVALTSRREPAMLDVLAAACAASGLFERAVTVADEALRLQPADALARALRERRELYRQRRPFRVTH